MELSISIKFTQESNTALATKIIGPGVTAFGDGPDGGREATFKGKVPFPFPPAEQWDGYGVFQAKFKATTEGTQKDQRWAILQAKQELTKWSKSAKRQPKMEYFIYCTNVSLTSAAGGGKDQLEKLLKQKQYKLKGYAIWDSNQLEVLLAGHTEIRKRFCHFFTTGDLLSTYADQIQFGHNHSAELILSSFISRELSADEDAKLSQAGDRSEDRIRLADVFVDLPSSVNPSLEPDEHPNTASRNSLNELLTIGACKLDPLAVEEASLQKGTSSKTNSKIISRYVFLGGPGSGKSTIGQFLAQIHRAAILSRKPKHRVEDKLKSIIENIRKKCDEEGHYWPTTPRYPFRIELNNFAKTLSGRIDQKTYSLSEYIRRSLSRDIEINHTQLIDWLKTYPILLVLDGLDEVPASSNRAEVIEAIQLFLNEAKDVECDLMIVASSRPDGYAGEFDGAAVGHRFLLPLPTQTALLCAQRYVTSKIAPKDAHRATEAMSILREAVKNPLISRLMHSPLQVTFMVTVVAASGKPSESRWQLFSDYYRTIYERELHKAVPPFDVVLNTRRSDIDTLHHRIGFILQTRSEQTGGTQSDITLTEFREITEDCLKENGLEEIDLNNQVDLIAGAANQRLVLLTSKTPGKLSFDVRSLQEYMAAACLTNDDSDLAIKRLEKIAPISYWRNVMMFAVGRFFSEPQLRPHRNKVRILCDDMNLRFTSERKLLPGSRLALDILFNGIASDVVPLHLKGLTKMALELLTSNPTPAESSIGKLSAVYRSELSLIYQEAISNHIGQSTTDLTISSWRLLQLLVDKDVEWAKEYWISNFPQKIQTQVKIVNALILISQHGANKSRFEKLGTHLLDTIALIGPKLSVEEAAKLVLGVEIPAGLPQDTWLNSLCKLANCRTAASVQLYHRDRGIGVTAKIATLSEDYKKSIEILATTASTPNSHPSWEILRLVDEFNKDPSEKSLIRAFNACKGMIEELPMMKRFLPWPIVQMMGEVEIATLSTPPIPHSFWRTQELAIIENGLEIEKLFKYSPELYSISARSVVVWELSFDPKKDDAKIFLSQIVEAISEGGSENHLEKISELFVGVCEIDGSAANFDPVFIEKRILSRCTKVSASSFLVNFSAESKVSPAWERFYMSMSSRQLLPSDSFRARALAIWCINMGSRDEAFLPLLKIAGLCSNSIDFQSINKAMPEDFSYLDKILPHQDKQLSAALVLLSIISSTDENIANLDSDGKISRILNSNESDWLTDRILTILDRDYERRETSLRLLDIISESNKSKDWIYRGKVTSIHSKIIESESSDFNKDSLVSLGLPVQSISKS